MAKAKTSSTQISYDTKTLIVVITLVTVFPIGIFLMFKWMKWPKWVKALVLIPVLLFTLAMVFSILVAIINPKGLVEKAQCAQSCETALNKEMCIEECSTPTETKTSPKDTKQPAY
ncbi:MAG: hypothetical protein Q7S79_01045 [bacterium]|nr:hypothetical protein [bacterium]